MLENLFRGLFDTDLVTVISVTDFLLCLGFSLVLGLVMAFAYMYRTRYTKSFVITLALLPAVVCVVIMLVNGNVGTGVAVAGAFSLVRFRSVPGTAKEICTLFLAMGAGLIAGMGYLGFAVLFTLVMCVMFVLYNRLDFGSKKNSETFNGSGSLTVTSPAGHGIVCKDDLVFTGGTYTVNSASHGLDANDSVRIANASFEIDAGKDIIHCENADDTSKGFIYISSGTVNGEAEGDGIAASAYLQIEGGYFDLLVGGGAENGSKASSGNYGGFMGGGHGGMNQNSTTTTTDTVSMKGLKAANSILISGGTFKIDSTDDSIHSDVSVTINGGTFEIASGDDAIHAEETLTVTAGNFNITESYEGLEALNIKIMGGDIKLVASDDGLNAAGGTDSSGTTGGRDGMFGGGKGGRGGGMSSGNGSIVISGGNLYINSSGDGLDANGTLEITGGYTVVVGPTQGDTATLDYDKSATITGGTFIGTGASGMAQSFSDSEQGVVALSVGNQAAGTKIVLKDKNGKTIIEHTPELSFAVVILSSPEITKGETYSITVGSRSGEFEAN